MSLKMSYFHLLKKPCGRVIKIPINFQTNLIADILHHPKMKCSLLRVNNQHFANKLAPHHRSPCQTMTTSNSMDFGLVFLETV
jgi:hypothetical protein